MREIKFKIWDNVDKKMLHTQDDIRSYAKEKGEMWQEIMIPGMFTNLEFLQFTGLLDNNVVEIYEGDIVIGYYTEKDINKGHIVKYATIYHEMGVAIGYDGLVKGVEVIGNIYENPELLTK